MPVEIFGHTYTLTGIVGAILGLVGLQSWTPWVVYVIDVLLILFGLVLPVVTFLIYLLRKILGFIQRRLGPMRVGPFGVFQTIADAVKLLQKEDLIPAHADRLVFAVAPFLVFVPAILVYVVIPFGKGEGFVAKDLNVGLVYLTAVSSITAVGIITAGWASDNKWSLLGGLRSAAQLVSYELPMTLALLGPAVMAGSLSLGKIVEAQEAMWFVVPQAVGFLVYFAAALAEVCHIPFDLPEAESELVAGYNVEYSGMRFGLFFMGEFANSFTICAIAVLLFWGGWHLWPGMDPVVHWPPYLAGLAAVATFTLLFWAAVQSGRRIGGINSATDFTIWGKVPAAIVGGIALVASALGFVSLVVFLTKTALLVFVLIWIRGTLPRVRVDQLMNFGWKVLIPVGLVHFLVVVFQEATGIPVAWVLNGLFLVFLVLLPVTAWRREWAYSDVSVKTS